MYVNEFFNINDEIVDEICDMKPKFGYNGFGEFVFYRTYSRIKENGKNESWNDVVLRVIEGVMSIRKDWYVKNRIVWDEVKWQSYAKQMAISMFNMKWLPPGRGLWAMGTPFVYQNGAMALNNCGFTKIHPDQRMSADFAWMMDALMLGVGIGFEPSIGPITIYQPKGSFIYQIPDSREGWVNSVKLLIDSYLFPNYKRIDFNYSLIRKRGLPIKGFGGLASGPDPLVELHIKITNLIVCYAQKQISAVRLLTDIGNLIGVCVVAGNVRRSAEIAIGNVYDEEFMDLKDYTKYPERANFGWMSNNTVKFHNTEDFEKMGSIAKRVTLRGEPGGMNMKNMPHGRIGKFDPVREDMAEGLNPLTLAA